MAFAPSAVAVKWCSLSLFAVLFAAVGVWDMRTAYVGWAEHRLTQRQFLGVVVRFVAMCLVLSFFLLSTTTTKGASRHELRLLIAPSHSVPRPLRC